MPKSLQVYVASMHLEPEVLWPGWRLAVVRAVAWLPDLLTDLADRLATALAVLPAER